jgi:hypothetical protein
VIRRGHFLVSMDALLGQQVGQRPAQTGWAMLVMDVDHEFVLRCELRRILRIKGSRYPTAGCRRTASSARIRIHYSSKSIGQFILGHKQKSVGMVWKSGDSDAV